MYYIFFFSFKEAVTSKTHYCTLDTRLSPEDRISYSVSREQQDQVASLEEQMGSLFYTNNLRALTARPMLPHSHFQLEPVFQTKPAC